MEIVIFDGMSGSGKTTRRSALIKAQNFDVMVIDRFSPSIWVYDALRGTDRTKEIIDFEEKFDQAFKPIFVFCYCEADIAKERDVDKELLYSYKEEHIMFVKYISEVCKYTYKLVLNTGQNDIEESIKLIQGKIYEKNSLRFGR